MLWQIKQDRGHSLLYGNKNKEMYMGENKERMHELFIASGTCCFFVDMVTVNGDRIKSI